MKGLLLVTGAILFQLNTFSSGALVFCGDIVTLATLGARQRDVYSHLLPPPSHFKPAIR